MESSSKSAKSFARGASLTGYGLVVGLIAVVGIGAITDIGGEVDGLFSTVGGELDSVVNDANSALPQSSASASASPSPSAFYSFSSHSFTSCGQTGQTGPSLGDCQSAYASAPWASDTNLFNITSPGVQQWTVPDTGTYRITLDGAAGGRSSASANPGLGGRVVGDINLTGGDTLYILVGQKGEGFDLGNSGSSYFATGGFNGGGGTGYNANQCENCAHASGGGASDIRLGGSTLNDRLMVAGGGGGGTTERSPYTTDLRNGGDGGGLIGHDGQGQGANSSGDGRGRGGTQSAGGSRGYPGQTYSGQDGSFGQGGRGHTNDAGGGGGGWYGGGGGGDNSSGGGGSSYTDAVLVSNITHSQGVNSGDGSVTIELLP